jgi:large subunit ribosomal protein L7/L12
VLLQAQGDYPVRVLKVVRELTGLDLLSAKTLVEAAPRAVGEGVDEATARRGANLLTAAGATAVAHQVDPR